MWKLRLGVSDWLTREGGQDLVEYAMLIGFIAVLLFIAVTIIGQSFSGTLGRIASRVLTW